MESQARIEKALDEGPHLLIMNTGMRSLWRIYCRTCVACMHAPFNSRLLAFLIVANPVPAGSEFVGVSTFVEAIRQFLLRQLHLEPGFVDDLLGGNHAGLIIDAIDENSDGQVNVVGRVLLPP